MATNNATNTSNPITVAQGGTGDASLTAYAVLCGGTTTTGAVQALAALGSSGNVLTSAGAGALPLFQAAASVGNLVLLSSQTASAVASVQFTSQFTGTYNTYILFWSSVSATSGTPILQLTLSTDNGSSYLNSGYLGSTAFVQTSSSASWSINTAQTSYLDFGTIGTTTNSAFMSVLTNFTNGATPQIYGIGGSGGYSYVGNSQQSTVNINALKIAVSSSTMSAGTFTLYGLLE